ncbi:MAG: hypothetical protein ACM37W_16485 [Actinomycetota bacterium]
MDLDQQIQSLIENAPQDGTTPQIVEAIAPALKLLAEQLRHPLYYLLQTLDRSWVMTTLRNRSQPGLEKRVIYAFPTLKDASAGYPTPLEANLVAVPVPVTHILFQMVAIDTLDSLVFFETAGNLESGTEVGRDRVQELVRIHLERYQSLRTPSSRPIPPDLA